MFSDGEIVNTYLPGWCSRHPALVTSWQPSPGNWVACPSEKEAAEGLCWWSVHESGCAWGGPKGHVCPLLLPVHSLGWGIDRVRGAWSAANFSKQLVFGLSHPSRLAQQRASPAVIGCFPWTWLKSA